MKTNQTTPASPFDVLSVLPTASAAEIKKAYFDQVRAHPPERNPEAFKRIRAAYEQINTPALQLDQAMKGLLRFPAVVLPAVAPLDRALTSQDVLHAARAVWGLERTDWKKDFKEVTL